MQQAQFATAASVQAVMAAHSRRTASRLRRLRAPLLAIDRIIDGLEVAHLAGRTCLDAHVCREVEHLSALVPLTEDIARAADTRELHAALLDLQEEVLDAVVPSRHLWTGQDGE